MHQKNRTRHLSELTILWLLLGSSSACWANNPQAGDYQVIDLKPARIDVVPLGLTDCTSMLAVSSARALAVCRSTKTDTADNYGLRVYLLATDTPSPRVLSVSRGLGDTYTVSLQKRSNAAATYKDLVLADAAAEFAYGTAIYQLQGDNLKYLGEIGYVSMSKDKNPASALNATVIQSTKGGFRVSFTQDVFALDKNGEYRRHDARKARKIFDGKILY